jgi:hypothetical protein
MIAVAFDRMSLWSKVLAPLKYSSLQDFNNDYNCLVQGPRMTAVVFDQISLWSKVFVPLRYGSPQDFNIDYKGLYHPLDGATKPKYKLLCLLTTKKIGKEKKALAFNWNRCCHLVLCLQLIPFHCLTQWPRLTAVAFDSMSLWSKVLALLRYGSLQDFNNDYNYLFKGLRMIAVAFDRMPVWLKVFALLRYGSLQDFNNDYNCLVKGPRLKLFFNSRASTVKLFYTCNLNPLNKLVWFAAY